MAWRVVIAGGGFGGLYAARRLERVLPPQAAQVTLVTDVNFLLYTPLLPGAAAGTLEPRHVVIPVREELRRTEIRFGRVTGMDPARSTLTVASAHGTVDELQYDQVILAPGSVSRVLPIPGLAEHALGFKTLAEAVAVRNQALLNLEIAESLDDPEARRPYLTFAFVGAGYAGVEGIAELQDYVADVIERYPRCRLDGTRWVLVEAQERILPEVSRKLADYTARLLERRGVEIKTTTRLESVDAESATLSNGTRIDTHTLVWTAGGRPNPVLEEWDLPLDERGRVEVDEYLRVRGRTDVWALGDCARVPNAGSDQVDPPTSQHALRQARALARSLRGKPRPYRYRMIGQGATLGLYKGIAEIFGLRLRGFLGWFATRTYHLYQLPLFSRKLRVVTDWTIALLFRRDIAELGSLGHPRRLEP